MLDLPDEPVLDKARLIGGCSRLHIAVDLEQLRSEVSNLPAAFWGSTGGRQGIQNVAEAVFIRGFPPALGDKPIGDRPALDHLPYIRHWINDATDARPMRCLLARLPADGVIAPHVDQPPYFSKTIRLHVPIITNSKAAMYCAGMVYHMQPGEVWALNNSTLHAVVNDHATDARTHLICDYLPSPALLAALAASDRGLGHRDGALERRLHAFASADDGR